jgi:hypothetical protein
MWLAARSTSTPSLSLCLRPQACSLPCFCHMVGAACCVPKVSGCLAHLSLGGGYSCSYHVLAQGVPDGPCCAATPDEDLSTFVAVLASSTTFYEGHEQAPGVQQQQPGGTAPVTGNTYDRAAASVMSGAQWLSQNLQKAAATASTHISAAGVGLTQVGGLWREYHIMTGHVKHISFHCSQQQ